MKAKKNVSDRVGSLPKKKKMNPFEVHINRQKHTVLGKKSKAEKGLPGISRSRSIRKRKATLLQEYKLKDKNNKFFDRRIGERDSAMTAEDKVIARYTAERMKVHSRKSLYNLGDTESLTHKGTSLAEIEKFEDPRSEDEEDDDGLNRDGKLDQDFVSDAHFGGGMLKKNDDGKSRKDVIEQLIADSKKRKAERQKLREQTLDMTEKLDEEWRNVLSLVSAASKAREPEPELKSERKFAAYDKLSKELKFEARGKPTDKLKTEEAMAKEEKEKLEKLENERLRRMLGDTEVTKTVKHRSADDLDDGFDFSDELPPKKKKFSAEDDESIEPINIVQNKDNDESDSSSEEDNSDDENDDSDENGVKSDNEAVEEEEQNGVENEKENGDSDSDDLSDLKDSSDSESEVEEINSLSKSKKSRKTSDVESSLNELPFTLSVPSAYEGFEKLVCNRSCEYQAVVLERMVKSNHPSLKDGSRQKLTLLLAYVLQHLQDTATESSSELSTFTVLDKLSPWLFDLAQFAPDDATNAMSEIIKEKYQEFCKKSRRFPHLDTLIFLKAVGVLFPASDFRHRLVTPTMTFMQQILTSCHVKTSTDVAIGLFVCSLLHEFTVLSKRLVPEAINFIRGILRSAQPRNSNLPYIPPFSAKNSFSLYVETSEMCEENLNLLSTNDFCFRNNSDEFKLSAVNLAVKLLRGFCDYFDEASAFIIFEPFVPLLDASNFSSPLKKSIQSVLELILSLKKKPLYKLVAEKKKPKPLRLYEPKIEDVYVLKKKSISKEKEEHDKLLYKYRKEVKGALREIRRDNTFLAKLKYNETKSSDAERQRKVKEIFGEAAQQAGEIRKIKRNK